MHFLFSDPFLSFLALCYQYSSPYVAYVPTM